MFGLYTHILRYPVAYSPLCSLAVKLNGQTSPPVFQHETTRLLWTVVGATEPGTTLKVKNLILEGAPVFHFREPKMNLKTKILCKYYLS